MSDIQYIRFASGKDEAGRMTTNFFVMDEEYESLNCLKASHIP
jgi:hypothetical protein